MQSSYVRVLAKSIGKSTNYLIAYGEEQKCCCQNVRSAVKALAALMVDNKEFRKK